MKELGVNSQFKCKACGQKYVLWIPLDRLQKQGVLDKRQAEVLKEALPKELKIKGLFTRKQNGQERYEDTDFIFVDGTVRESLQCKCKNWLDVDLVLQGMETAGKIIKKAWKELQ